MTPPRLAAVHPVSAIEGARISIVGSGFPLRGPVLPAVHLGGLPARVVYASPTRLDVRVPSGVPAGQARIDVEGAEGTLFLNIATPFATELHQVDNPAFDQHGNLYVTYSGRRGEQVPVSIFRIRSNGTREPFSTGIVNPTSMAVASNGQLYVSSRFEGTVYRVNADGSAEPFATDLGVACGLAFAPDGTLFVGDRSGTIFSVDRAGHPMPIASLPSSVAAFHLALGPDNALYVSGPTLSSYDVVYRVERSGRVSVRSTAFGRPQGLAFDAHGVLYVVEALAGASGVYRVPPEGDPEMVLAGPGLVGLAFSPDGRLVVCSNENAFVTTPRA